METKSSEKMEEKSTIFIFDSMRTRSHLFFRYLSTSPELHPIYHPFVLAAYLGPDRWPQSSYNTPARTEQIVEDGKTGNPNMTHCASRAALQSQVATANARHKTPLSSEHVFNILRQPILHALHRDPTLALTHLGSNPTHLPDEIWHSLRPVFLIRHPVPHVASGYAALSTLGMSVGVADEDLGIFCSWRYHRLLFDFFAGQGRTPLVVDADDLLFHTGRVTSALARGLGLDAGRFSERWDAMPEEERPSDPVMRAWMATFHASTGIARPEEREGDERDVEAACGRWKERWGEEVAGALRGLVEENLGHYEYLAGFKV